MSDLISVIVPVYKVEKYLSKCVESIIHQTYQNLEIILVDDGSPDSCGKMCDEYAKKDQRIKVIHQTNSGVSCARNIGLEKSTGDFITFVDSDDYLEPSMYEELVAQQKVKNADLVFCRAKYINGSTEYLANEISLVDLCKTVDPKYFFNTGTHYFTGNILCIEENIMCSIWRILFKKSAIQNVKFNVNVKLMEDVLFLTKIICKGNIIIDYLDRYLYNYLIRCGSASHRSFDNQITNHKSYLLEMTNILKGTQYENYLSALEFILYSDIVVLLTRSNMKMSLLKEIQGWNSNKNYKASKSFIYGFKGKVKYFLIHWKLYFIFKILLKFKDRKQYK